MSEIGQVFIARCRHHFAEDFLPKIERCLELLSDEQIWWRANPQSNSIGNLLLHLSGNVRQWIVSGIGGMIDARDRDAEFAARAIIPRDELLARLKQTLSEADNALANFDSDRLLERMKIQGVRCDSPGSDSACGRTLLDARRTDRFAYEAANRGGYAFP